MSWRQHLKSRRLALALFVAAALVAALAERWPRSFEPARAAAELTARFGAGLETQAFSWVDPARVAETGPFDWHAAVFLARPEPEALRDVYTAEFRVKRDGAPFEVRRVTDLTRTADGDEDVLAVSGKGLAAFAGRVGPEYNSVSVVDFRGEPAALTSDWPWGWRLANRITNLQRTGRPEGIGWRTYIFRDAPSRLTLGFKGSGGLSAAGGGGATFEIAADGAPSSQNIIVQEMLKGRPAFLAWAVDTAREVPWIGRRTIEWMEKYWFDFNDWLARKRYELLGEEGSGAAAEYAAMLATKPSLGFAGWPPADLEPLLRKAEQGEGAWMAVEDEAFTTPVDGPPLFYRTFLRVDPERPFAVAHIVAWDPARVELRMVAGVREPVSTTGLKGLGEVPREGPRAGEIERLVGAFNGAFQAVHGEWGMAIDRQYYLRPRPFGATLATYDDGRTALGTWPNPVGEMPEGMRDMRQNVQPLVENGVYNPYQRVWWGGVPAGVEERVVTARSGVCLTFGKKLVYIWGEHLSPESLGAAMIASGCDYGLHLDMNSGHCGFEFYRVDPVGQQPKMSRALVEWSEAEGPVPRRPDLVFRAKKMAREMGQMRFPRYVSRDPRDFFYLLRRRSLFDAPPAPGSGSEWQTVGAVEGMPVPMVRAAMGADRFVYKLDPGQVAFSIADREPEDALLAVPFSTQAAGVTTGLRWGGEEKRPMQSGESGLAFDGTGVAWREAGDTDGRSVVQGLSVNVAKLVPAAYAVGFDADGYVVVAASNGGAQDLGALMDGANERQSIVLIAPDETAPSRGDAHWLVASGWPVPAAYRIFQDVEPVPPSVWREVYRQQGSAFPKGDGEE
jgi:hypothetical protein